MEGGHPASVGAPPPLEDGSQASVDARDHEEDRPVETRQRDSVTLALIRKYHSAYQSMGKIMGKRKAHASFHEELRACVSALLHASTLGRLCSCVNQVWKILSEHAVDWSGSSPTAIDVFELAVMGLARFAHWMCMLEEGEGAEAKAAVAGEEPTLWQSRWLGWCDEVSKDVDSVPMPDVSTEAVDHVQSIMALRLQQTDVLRNLTAAEPATWSHVLLAHLAVVHRAFYAKTVAATDRPDVDEDHRADVAVEDGPFHIPPVMQNLSVDMLAFETELDDQQDIHLWMCMTRMVLFIMLVNRMRVPTGGTFVDLMESSEAEGGSGSKSDVATSHNNVAREIVLGMLSPPHCRAMYQRLHPSDGGASVRMKTIINACRSCSALVVNPCMNLYDGHKWRYKEPALGGDEVEDKKKDDTMAATTAAAAPVSRARAEAAASAACQPREGGSLSIARPGQVRSWPQPFTPAPMPEFLMLGPNRAIRTNPLPPPQAHGASGEGGADGEAAKPLTLDDVPEWAIRATEEGWRLTSWVADVDAKIKLRASSILRGRGTLCTQRYLVTNQDLFDLDVADKVMGLGERFGCIRRPIVWHIGGTVYWVRCFKCKTTTWCEGHARATAQWKRELLKCFSGMDECGAPIIVPTTAPRKRVHPPAATAAAAAASSQRRRLGSGDDDAHEVASVGGRSSRTSDYAHSVPAARDCIASFDEDAVVAHDLVLPTTQSSPSSPSEDMACADEPDATGFPTRRHALTSVAE